MLSLEHRGKSLWPAAPCHYRDRPERTGCSWPVARWRRQHDRHDCLIAIKNRARHRQNHALWQRVELIHNQTQESKTYIMFELLITKRAPYRAVFHSCQRHVQIEDQLIRIWQISRDLSKTIHIIGKISALYLSSSQRHHAPSSYAQPRQRANMRQPDGPYRFQRPPHPCHCFWLRSKLRASAKGQAFASLHSLRVETASVISVFPNSLIWFTIRNPHPDRLIARVDYHMPQIADTGSRTGSQPDLALYLAHAEQR